MFTLSLPRTLAGALLLSGAANAQAATLLVTVKADAYDGVCSLHCSLRDAVAVANQSGMANTILLPSGTYTLTRLDPLDGAGLPIDEDGSLSGDLDIVGELRIKGAGAGKSVIKGPSDHYRAITHRLAESRPGAQLILEGLTLKDGHAPYNGGAVENHGRLLLREVLAERNIARIHMAFNEPTEPSGEFDNGGGAIANYGDLVVLASHFLLNFATTTHDKPSGGGAIYNRGSVLVRDSHFWENAVSTPLYSAGTYEGGSALYNEGQATVERSSFEFNGDYGNDGAISNEGGTLALTNSTLSGNWNDGLTNGLHDQLPTRRSKATLTNVTITQSGYFGYEYGVKNLGELSIRNSVITGNPYSYASYSYRNEGSDFSYQAIGLLLDDSESNCSADLFVPADQVLTHLLAPLTQQSNKTKAHPLRPGSPAIDAGVGDCVSLDQRGVARPKDGNGDGVALCDLGAYEFIP